ncbi:UL16-binding protein 1 [Apodemus speciosus]|uniref:UL16-binding protein 1 n=1 Tax=Apodemus speciosus TaxID=105296 RepID=A0ABQ0F762_APOSI
MAASLCNSFKVDRSESGQWRNEVQGLLNRQTFFLYKDNKCHAIGAYGNTMNATKICEKQVDTLKHGGDIFKGMLLQMWEEINTIRGPLTLQAEMCCQYEEDKHFRGSSVVILNGKNMFHVDTTTGNWTDLDPRFSKMMDTWKKDRDIAAILDKTSGGTAGPALMSSCHTGKNIRSRQEPTCLLVSDLFEEDGGQEVARVEESSTALSKGSKKRNSRVGMGLMNFKGHLLCHTAPNMATQETTIKTLDRIQNKSDNTLVIIASILPVMFIGLIILGVCYVLRRRCEKKKRTRQLVARTRDANSPMKIRTSCSQGSTGKFPVSAWGTMIPMFLSSEAEVTCVHADMDVQSSSLSLLGDSWTLPETSSANEADEFLTASQNSVLLTLFHTDGNP